MSSVTHEAHIREWFLEDPTLLLRIALGYFHVCVDSVSQLEAVGQLLLTESQTACPQTECSREY